MFQTRKKGTMSTASELYELKKEFKNLKIKCKRASFLFELDQIILHEEVPIPTFLEILCPEEIKLLLMDSIESMDVSVWSYHRGKRFVKLVARAGYKDEPILDENGRPQLCQTTPLHLVIRRELQVDKYESTVIALFQIYSRYDLNYIDDEGNTHFAIACIFSCKNVVKEFLKLGQNPEFPALHLALRHNYSMKIAKMLLRGGADPNSTDLEELTPLHIICNICDDVRWAKMLFETVDERHQLVQIDARDMWGNTPLHLSLKWSEGEVCELLLRRGANPNVANEEGLTPLHIIIIRHKDDCQLLKKFFKINDEICQTVLIDARDELGRTPLDWAVEKLMPQTVGILLDRGAYSSEFRFPYKLYKNCDTVDSVCESFYQVSDALAIVELLEKKGYEMKLNDASRIMTLFDEIKLFETSKKFATRYDEETFASKAKKIMVISNLSLYDLIQLRPEKAAERLTCMEYVKFARSEKFYKLPAKYQEVCAVHLREKISRRFCRSWALQSFMKLTNCRLPFENCEMIIDQLEIGDLSRICAAVNPFRKNK